MSDWLRRLTCRVRGHRHHFGQPGCVRCGRPMPVTMQLVTRDLEAPYKDGVIVQCIGCGRQAKTLTAPIPGMHAICPDCALEADGPD